jgi:hypothetical protein
LEEEQAVTRAEVNRNGTLLRVQLVDADATSSVIARLHELGFMGEVTPNETSPGRWYGRDAVGELSGEEAGVIARRVVPKFAREHHLRNTQAIVRVVTAALHQCFVTTVLGIGTPTRALDDSSSQAVRAATQAQRGDELAAALGMAIQTDLAAHRASTG